MRITVAEDNTIQLEEVYNGILLKTNSGEKMGICMRDTGFEFTYQGRKFLAQGGHIKELSIRGNLLVDEYKGDPVDACHSEKES